MVTKKKMTDRPVHPMEVHIGFKTFKIQQKSLEKDGLYGCVEFPKALITVDPNQSEEDYRGTLLHEICHVGYDLFGLGDDDEMPSIGNEYLTTVTSNMMQMLHGLNPELFTFLFPPSDE
tara:strand:- start:66 stop:422 length:357 start_codon:yes stop_codon:yes gene_type:complete